MKSLLSFCALLLFIGFSAPAHAYRINVLDAPPGTPILTQPFTFAFTRCNSASRAGCFDGQNETNAPLTTLQLTFPSTAVFAANAPTCSATQPATSLFTNCQTLVQNGYQIWFFSGGNIPSGNYPADYFLIREEGIDPGVDGSGFPPGIASTPTHLTVPSTVPEPNSVVLLSTGLLLGGFLFTRKRNLLLGSVAANR